MARNALPTEDFKSHKNETLSSCDFVVRGRSRNFSSNSGGGGGSYLTWYLLLINYFFASISVTFPCVRQSPTNRLPNCIWHNSPFRTAP